MFGFLQNAAKREALKLNYQNKMAANFVTAFDPVLAQSVMSLLEQASATWEPGQLMPKNILEAMFRANKALRLAYDKTPARHAKSFDEAYRPIMGWKEYYKDFI